jgi:hypothetical protein
MCAGTSCVRTEFLCVNLIRSDADADADAVDVYVCVCRYVVRKDNDLNVVYASKQYYAGAPGGWLDLYVCPHCFDTS